MDLIIVAGGDLAPLGRRLAHAVSQQKMHNGAFWTVKHYQDNEFQITGKQPIMFPDDNELTKSYADALPEHFRGYGTVGAAGIGLILFPLIIWFHLYIIHRFSVTRRKREYRKLQYEYVLSRFLKDEFETYIAGIEGLS